MSLRITNLLLVFLFLSHLIFSQNETKLIEKSNLHIGDRIEIQSKILNENRALNIYLPEGYSSDSTKEYPVIYLLDGSINEDFIHISGIVQFGSLSWINIIPETIIVGISNVDRKRDFTFPTTVKKDKEDFPTTGKSEQFIRFIEKELQPFIDANYNTNKVRTIIGQSLGGLLATEILLKKPQLFDNYIIVSPSLWWDSQSLLAIESKKYKANKTVYIAVGKEGRIMEKTAKGLYKKLKVKNTKNTKLYYQYFKAQNHGDVLHLAVYDAFEKVFKFDQ